MSDSSPYHVVQEPDNSSVLPALLEVLDATRNKQNDLERFRWLYQRNPAGPAVVWTLRKRDTGQVVGYTACIPRRMRVSGRLRLCWIGADFSILQKYRSLGLALQLRRAARTEIDAGRAEFLYSHPNDRMAVIHDKVGHRKVGTMIRLARLVSVRPLLEERRVTRPLAGVAAGMIDPLLRLAGPEWRTGSGGGTATEEPLSFSQQYDELFARETAGCPVMGVRDAEYLHWRYQQNPLHQFRLLTCRDADAGLAGYLIFSDSVEDNTLIIHDIFPGHVESVLFSLLKGLWRVARTERRRSISITLISTSPTLLYLKRFQYAQRPETTQMYVHIPSNDPDHSVLTEGANWHVCIGDRDV